MEHRTRKALKLGLLWAIILNFAVFVGVAFYLGGDAINGGIKDGVYYLSSYRQETAVSPAVWYYSQAHAAVTFGSFIAYMIFRRWSRVRKLSKRRRR